MDFDEDWSKVLVPLNATVKDVICNLNESGLQIAIVVSSDKLFYGTITDGDIRRALLRGLTLDSNISELLNREAVVASPLMSTEMIRHMMEVNRIHQVPIIDKDRRVVGLFLWDRMRTQSTHQNTMVIMAGGLGKRLMPYTETCPKPMLLVGGKPILEHIIERAKASGIERFVLAIRYLGHIIEDYFGDGKLLGVHIEYLKEEEPLGTVGALSLLEKEPTMPFLVSNSDVLTDIHYGDLLDFHVNQGAIATMAVRMYELQHPFGVVHTQGFDLIGFEEKPIYQTKVNTGVYVFNPDVLRLLKKNEHYEMPALFEKLMHMQQKTIVYPIHEPWLDVGQKKDYHQAKKKKKKKKKK